MKKIVVILGLILLGITFGLIRSENWTPQNLTITSNTNVTLPYNRTGFLIKSLNAVNVNVVLTKAGVTATDNITAYNWFDYYPDAFQNLTNDTIVLNVSSGTANVFIETYELNE